MHKEAGRLFDCDLELSDAETIVSDRESESSYLSKGKDNDNCSHR